MHPQDVVDASHSPLAPLVPPSEIAWWLTSEAAAPAAALRTMWGVPGACAQATVGMMSKQVLHKQSARCLPAPCTAPQPNLHCHSCRCPKSAQQAHPCGTKLSASLALARKKTYCSDNSITCTLPATSIYTNTPNARTCLAVPKSHQPISSHTSHV